MACNSGCCSHHNNNNIKNLKSKNHYNGKIKILITKIILSIFFLILGFAISKHNFKVLLFLVSYFIIGKEILHSAFKNILKGKIFDENFLMSIATLGAFIIGEYPEGIAVMIFYQIGELFQEIALNNSKKSIINLMNLKPDYANLEKNNKIEKVSPETVKKGDIIIIKPGEKIPLDGKIISGNTLCDTSTITGESLPRELSIEDEVLSGFINISSLIYVKVTKTFENSTISKIIDLVENSANKKSKTENFIKKFAKYYTPVITLIAFIIAIFPPLLFNQPFHNWFYRALVFLVISCPCALVLSIPLGFFGGIGSASKHGILIKGSNFLEALNSVDTIIMDKTGTLTKGIFKVTKINNYKISKEELLMYAAHSESFSNHPIAKSILQEYEKNYGSIDNSIIDNYTEISGYGIKASINGKSIIIGNEKFMNKENISIINSNEIGTIIHICIDNDYKGNILISDEIKEESKEAITEMKKLNINNIIMLTGDNNIISQNIAQKLNINTVFSELLPHEKVEILEKIYKKKHNTNKKIIFVGDGINDAPILARADIGIAMGGIGSDIAIETADIVIMNDDPKKVVTAIKIAEKTKKIVWQNIFFSIFVKIIVLFLGAGGIATMWEAVFADVGVALIAIFNAMKIIKTKFD